MSKKRLKELETEIAILKQKLQIEQLQTQIERKKRERAELNQRNPWSITWGDNHVWTLDPNTFTEKLRRSYDSKGDQRG